MRVSKWVLTALLVFYLFFSVKSVYRQERLLFFFSSYPKHQHLKHLIDDWSVHSKQFPDADALIFVGGSLNASYRREWEKAVKQLSFQKSTLITDDWNPGYHEGAMRAIAHAHAQGWWDSYEWVIRLNPDVLIYNAYILKSMLQQKSIWAIFANCWPSLKRIQVHTDFFAVRPQRLPRNAFSGWENEKSAEVHATNVFKPLFIDNNRCGWIISKGTRTCRVNGNGLWHTGPKRLDAPAPLIPFETTKLIELPSPKCHRQFVSYRSSELEKRWLANIAQWSEDPCKYALQDIVSIEKWLNKSISTDIFSSFKYQVNCDGKVKEVHEFIEPLASILRNTRGVCKGFPTASIMSTDHILVAKALFPGERVHIYDFGASLWAFGSQDWLYRTYVENGFQLAGMSLFEAKKYQGSEIYRGVPKHLLPIFHYYNIPISGKPHDPFYAWSFIKHDPMTFKVVKLDIDKPALEIKLVKDLMSNDVDEFFFEHHTMIPEMINRWWKDNTMGTLADTYAHFISLRKSGVRAHAWF